MPAQRPRRPRPGLEDDVARGLGGFDAIVSIGAFEHFCSVEERVAGEQDAIYRRFFALCHALLRPGGRLYLQTMVWGRNAIPPEAVSLRAPRESAAYLLALIQKLYPGSWLPDGEAQIARDAAGFALVSSNSGRLDYLATLREWGRRDMRRTALRNPKVAISLYARYATSRDFRYQVECLSRGCTTACFQREIIDHRRMVFERVPG